MPRRNIALELLAVLAPIAVFLLFAPAIFWQPALPTPRPSQVAAVTPVPTPTPTPYVWQSVRPTATFDNGETPTPTLAPVGPQNPVYGHCTGDIPRNSSAGEAYLWAKVGNEEARCGWWVIAKESGWNPADLNGSSGACGLPQSLYCIGMAPGWVRVREHGDWGKWITASCSGVACPSDPNGQIDWFVAYVRGRYGSMFEAWVMWQRQGWY